MKMKTSYWGVDRGGGGECTDREKQAPVIAQFYHSTNLLSICLLIMKHSENYILCECIKTFECLLSKLMRYNDLW